MGDLDRLRARFAAMEKHVKVSKVYLETHRDKILVDSETLKKAKQFFEERGIRTAGGITLTVSERNRFQTFCYSDPDHRRAGCRRWSSSRRGTSTRSSSTTSSSRAASPRSRSARGASGAGRSTAWRCWTRRPATSSWPRRGRSTRRSGWSSSTRTGTTTSTGSASTSRRSRRSSTRSTPAPRRATRCAATSTCSRTTATRSGATSRTSPGPQRRGMGRPVRLAHPRPLRRAAVAHPLRQGARDHALRLRPDPDARAEGPARPVAGAGDELRLRRDGRALQEGRRLLRARADVGPGGRLVVREDRPDHRPAGKAGGREELQALPLDGRGLPAQLHGHGRDPHRPATGVPGPRRRSCSSPRRPRTTRHRREDRAPARGRARAS